MSPTTSQNLFNHEILLIPFTSADYKSMFAVVGANEIKNYAKIGHTGSRPCIVHLDALPASKSCHDANFVGNKIRSYLNAMWSHRFLGTRDPELNPFNKRSMPLIRLNNRECCVQVFLCFDFILQVTFAAVLPGTTVGCPDKGALIIKHASTFLGMGPEMVASESAKKFSDQSKYVCTTPILLEVRKDIASLLNSLTEEFVSRKQYGDKQNRSNTEDEVGSISDCCSGCSMSTSGESSSNDSESTAYSSNDLDRDSEWVCTEDEDDECDKEFDFSDCLNECEVNSQCGSFGSDASVASLECGQSREASFTKEKHSLRDLGTSLICPGDVVEYRLSNETGVDGQSRVVVVQNSSGTKLVRLQNGTILRPNRHAVKRIKMRCGATDNLISDPLSQWTDLSKCTLQTGSYDPLPHSPLDCDPDDQSRCSSSDCSGDNEARPTARMRTSEGLTNVGQKTKMTRVRNLIKRRQGLTKLPKFSWCRSNDIEYFCYVDDINDKYRKMLEIGQVPNTFRKSGHGVCAMINATSKEEFKKASKVIQRRYKRHKQNKKATLRNFSVHTEFVPDVNRPTFLKHPTENETWTKEQILQFEHYLSALSITKCTVCLECSIEENTKDDESDFVCSSCRKRKDDQFFIRNNLHPVWYEVDKEGSHVLERDGKRKPMFEVPDELACLSMAEKLLIRRCANFVPSIHMKNGVFGLKGHCVTYPQDITDMCNELPQRKESVLTFIRNLGNRNTQAVFPKSLVVNKNRVLNALWWLKRHNPCYKDVTIVESHLDWMKGKDESNLSTSASAVNVAQRARSRLAETEKEHVSHAHESTSVLEHTDLDVSAMHANVSPTLPLGEASEPIKELIRIAENTGQIEKVMKFPPVDHDSPIS